ncbi:MAG: hypothetical protein J6X70_09810 [Muribaculaceae bacterium]|nr:hypothetical protein [Muribaculaceae bacterium]
MKLKDTEMSNNPIYGEFFSNSNLETTVEMTKWCGKYSKNSFCFINPKVKYKEREGVVLNKLREVFDIKSDSFKKKFEMAISGDGQEVKRISTLHSSSLAALLLLYSVSESKQLECFLNEKKYTFTDSFFEVKTNVKDSHFSNMDVVLVGKNSEGRDVIFFLESKFSEYFNTGMCDNISLDAYEKEYEELGLREDNAIQGLYFKRIGKDNKECLQIKSNTPLYCDGIKQMISHYIGVSNFIEQGKNALDPNQEEKPFFDKLDELRNKGAEILLGEVLFDFGNKVSKGKTKLKNYFDIYKALATILNAHTSKLCVLPEVLTYQKLLEGFELDKKVKDFYQL